MPVVYYTEALRQGQREQRACMARGESPYLPVLDEVIKGAELAGEEDLGLVQIPAERIVGTRSASRANLFCHNFMPLAPEHSEFASKWERLCHSHLEEGIREPIKAYEFMNRYYVEEGNKRVSVLKFFDAVSIPAQVRRILPRPDGSREVTGYYEFVAFYRLTQINEVACSKPGSYDRLQQLVGKERGESWSEWDRVTFLSCFRTFRGAYESAGGRKLHATAGDALLAYLEIYGYAALREESLSQIKSGISKMWEEISLQQEESPIDVKLVPEEKKQGLLSKVLSGAEPRLMKVAFVHDAAPETSSWTRGHEQGRAYVQRTMAGHVVTTAYYNAMASDPLAVIRQAMADGNTTVFTTSPRLMPAALRAAVDAPQATVLNCSLNQSHRYIRTYYARMYEAKFIIGAIAGALAGSDPVGYLCDYPIFGQIAGINAFALGVQMVNPRTRVYLEWTSVGGADAALSRLTDRGIRLISSLDMVRRGDEGRGLGLNLISGGQTVNLATPLWQWGTYYEEMIRRIRNRAARSEYGESGKALNYYWGMSAGVVDLRCSQTVPPATRKLAGLLKESIRSGACNPFRGPLYTQSGRVLENDGLLTPQQIIEMDYLMENVEGCIPRYDELSEMGKATVDLVGIGPATKEKRS